MPENIFFFLLGKKPKSWEIFHQPSPGPSVCREAGPPSRRGAGRACGPRAPLPEPGGSSVRGLRPRSCRQPAGLRPHGPEHSQRTRVLWGSLSPPRGALPCSSLCRRGGRRRGHLLASPLRLRRLGPVHDSRLFLPWHGTGSQSLTACLLLTPTVGPTRHRGQRRGLECGPMPLQELSDRQLLYPLCRFTQLDLGSCRSPASRLALQPPSPGPEVQVARGGGCTGRPGLERWKGRSRRLRTELFGGPSAAAREGSWEGGGEDRTVPTDRGTAGA